MGQPQAEGKAPSEASQLPPSPPKNLLCKFFRRDENPRRGLCELSIYDLRFRIVPGGYYIAYLLSDIL